MYMWFELRVAYGVEAERLERQAGEVREALARGLVADTDDTERDTRRLQAVGHGQG